MFGRPKWVNLCTQRCKILAEFELQFAEGNAKDSCAEELFMNERPWSVRAREALVPANGR
jgi:hypothetical protein